MPTTTQQEVTLAGAILLYGDTRTHPNVHWRTGFTAPDPVIYVESGERRILLVGGMELGRAQKQADVTEVLQFDTAAWRERLRKGSEFEAHAVTIAETLKELGTDRVTVEPDFPVGLAVALDEQDVVVEVKDDLFRAERRRKSAEEQEAVARSQAAAVAAMTAARAVLHDAEAREGKLWYRDAPLTSDVVLAAIDAELLRHDCVAVEGTIVAGGPGAADPHVSNTGHLDAGVGVIVDIFPQSRSTHYFGDITRTYVVGEPTPAWLKQYEAVKSAQQVALSMLRAGVSSRAVHRAVCQTLYDAGYGTTVEGLRREGVAMMNHGTGHGLGLVIHEAPRINDFEGQLEEGDVVTIEPGLYSEKDGSVRIENTVVITADGYRELTDIDVEWRP
ncbi:MAG: M24 family metallopeptidase [Candidatus Dormibacteria bacterium]